MNSTRVSERFYSIPLVAFRFLGTLRIKLFDLREDDTDPVLLCGEQKPLTPDQFDELGVRGCETLLVQRKDFSLVSQKLLSFLDEVLADTSIPAEVRFALLQIAYADEIERSFRRSCIGKYIELSQAIGYKVSAQIRQSEMDVPTLFHSVHHNSSIYTHVTNVTAYAVVLAKALKIASPDELDRIAVGCMLHEVGKLYVPKELLSKTGRLSAHDHEELDRIPQLAYESLCDHESLDRNQLMMIYQQSERLDGTGYPVRNVSDEIHTWAKLLAVVDAFDASTNEREFRPALDLDDALLCLTNGAKKQFDPEIILCWITGFQPQ